MTESSPTQQRTYARIYIRTKCDLPINITYIRDSESTMFSTRCTNLCVGGFFADLNEQLDVGQRVAVAFLSAGGSAALRVDAEVRHVNGTDTGFQFLDQSETGKEALRQFFTMESQRSGY